MRELRQAAREGRHALLVSLGNFPRRHPFLISGLAIFGLAVIAGFGLVESIHTGRDVNVLRPQVTQIVQAAAACKPPVTTKRLATCVARIEAGLQACRLSPSCRKAFDEVLTAPKPRKGVVHQTPTTAGQQPAPAPAGAKGEVHGSHKHPPAKHPSGGQRNPKPAAPPPPVPPVTAPASSPSDASTPELPGNSGSGSSSTSPGAKTCVEVDVSACVKAGLDAHLP